MYSSNPPKLEQCGTDKTLKALRRDLQEGLDQLDSGEGKPLDMDSVKAKARAIRKTKL